MNKLKNLALGLSISTLTATLPYITYVAQALPINDIKEREIKAPLTILNIENKNTKSNQKEEMAEVLVSLYNKYNHIFKKGIEINDVKNSNLYFNITKQKSEIKRLIQELVNYPYSVINSTLEQKFLKSNILFCHLTNEFIKSESLDNILRNSKNINEFKEELNSISDIIEYSLMALENSNKSQTNEILTYKLNKINYLIDSIEDSNSLKSNFLNIKNLMNDINDDISLSLTNYIHI